MRRADSFNLADADADADADSGGEEVLFGAAGILFPLEFSSVARCIYLRRVHGTRAWTSEPELEKEPSVNGLDLKSISAQRNRHYLLSPVSSIPVYRLFYLPSHFL